MRGIFRFRDRRDGDANETVILSGRQHELLAEESHNEGVATVMVTHDLGVLGHCDRVLEMADGKLRPREA